MPRQRWSSLLLVAAVAALVPALARAQGGEPGAAPSASASAAAPSPAGDGVPANGAIVNTTAATAAGSAVPIITTAQPESSAPQTVPSAVSNPLREPVPAPSKQDTGRFEFGSYGRVHIASDLRGGTGRPANVVSHGDRIDEEDYAELELRREDTFFDEVKSKVVATLAFFGPFFHFTGNLAQQIAIRNLYAQATYKEITLWAGSRMYRGDDIYLLDWWPLDNQNTVGGGAGWKHEDTSLAVHVGQQRLDNVYQFQQVAFPTPFADTTQNVLYLDRPRTIETLKATQQFHLPGSKAGIKAILYGEAHEISAGVQRDTMTNMDKALPSDTGFLAGGELAYWTGERDTFVQVYARYARGLAAYDPLAVPTTFANDRTTAGSSETLFAVGGNWEKDMFGVLYAGYLRFFRDGDPSPTTTQKYDEGIIVARPQLYIGDYWGIALEGSYQQRRYAVLDPSTDAPLVASAVRGAIMPYFSPSGRGSYKRPQLRLMYAITGLNQGARALYPVQDVFAQRSVEHFLGLGVEWWFNSSSYP